MQSLAIQQKMSENADMSRSANQLASNILLNRKKKTNKRRMSVKKIMGMDDKQKKRWSISS